MRTLLFRFLIRKINRLCGMAARILDRSQSSTFYEMSEVPIKRGKVAGGFGTLLK